MAPSAAKLEAALIEATCDVYKTDPDATTVNKVRRQTEEQLDLDEGFFADGEWKQKSKSIIKKYVVSTCLLPPPHARSNAPLAC